MRSLRATLVLLVFMLAATSCATHRASNGSASAGSGAGSGAGGSAGSAGASGNAGSSGASADAGGSGAGGVGGAAGAAGTGPANDHDAGAGSDAGSSTRHDAGLAADGGGVISCDPTKILCKRIAPTCPSGQVPSVSGNCYGDCVLIEACPCSAPEQCPDSNHYTCFKSAGHCGPYV